MMSKISNAVVAGSSATGTGSGDAGACSVSGGLLMRNRPIASTGLRLLLLEARENLPPLPDTRDLAVAQRHHEIPAVDDPLHFAVGGLDRVGFGPDSASLAKLLAGEPVDVARILAATLKPGVVGRRRSLCPSACPGRDQHRRCDQPELHSFLQQPHASVLPLAP